MVRKLALAVSLALGTLSVPAHALGLGELSSKSTLNQNFNGHINLLSVQPDEVETIRVRLADSDAFKRSGVDRPFFLTLLKFEPTLSAAGKPVVRVTSDFPIREPFLNFLVEVNWPNGRMLREYTVLLDPPTTTQRRPPKVAPVAKSAPSAARPAAPVSRPKAASSAATTTAGFDYGPVKANDTAWGIAKQVRPSGVTMEQMMMALLEANPHAFVDNNINRLRKGQILRVPSSAEIAELGRQEARRAYREQQDAWLARRDEKLRDAAAPETDEQAPATADGVASTSDPDDQLRIATARPEGEGEAGAGDDDAQTPTVSDLKTRLLTARENVETSRQEAETLRSQVDDLEARLRDMQKLLSLKDDQLAQLQDRVATGEPVTAETAAEPAVEVAETETAIAAETLVPSFVPGDDYVIPDIPPQVDPDQIVLSGGLVADGVEAQVPAPTLEIPPQIDPDEIVLGGAPDEAAATGGAEGVVIEGAGEVEPAAPAAEVAVEPVLPAPAIEVESPAQATAPGLSFIPKPLAEMVEKNIVPIAAGGVALLGLLGWLFTRGRRRGETEPVLAGTTAAAAGAATADAGLDALETASVDMPVVTPDVLDDLPDSSFLDEFSPADINALQDETGEVDPVSEADVYIAYGRYQQAEELLGQALERDPDRMALKHKLLEVHYATRNGTAFAALAQEMVGAGQDVADPDAWSRAQDMGREIAPDNPLFVATEGGDATEAAAVQPELAPVDDDTLSLNETLALDDAELTELTAAYEQEGSDEPTVDAPSEVSITLDLEDEAPAPMSEETRVAADLPESISLDELDFEMPAREEAAGGASQETDADDDVSHTLDLEAMMAEAEAAVDAEESTINLDSGFSADELQAQLDELSDLSVLETEAGDDEGAPRAAGGNIGLVEEDTGFVQDGLDQPISLDEVFDGDEPEGEVADVIELSGASHGGNGADEDDVTTKLDLARAYVDMGDEEGARSILEEVVAEGNESQRGDAEKLLGQLG